MYSKAFQAIRQGTPGVVRLRTAKISFCYAIPRSPIFLVAQRLSHLTAFHGMPAKFLRWIHGPSPVHEFLLELFDFYTNGRNVNLVKIAQTARFRCVIVLVTSSDSLFFWHQASECGRRAKDATEPRRSYYENEARCWSQKEAKAAGYSDSLFGFLTK